MSMYEADQGNPMLTSPGATPDGPLPPEMGGGMDGSFASLDPEQVAAILMQVLGRMQADDQYAMQVQMQMAQMAMGQQQQVAAEQAIAALQQAMAAEGQTLDGAASVPPPGREPAASPGADGMDQLMNASYPRA